MKPLKHSKIKNTMILFELLVQQLTMDTINNKESRALPILQKYFGKNTELAKELKLYTSLIEERMKSELHSDKLIDAILKMRTKLNNSSLKKQKYNLLNEIRSSFVEDEFFRTKVRNYKLYASIYKLFEYSEDDNPTDMVKSRICIVENLLSKESKQLEKLNDAATVLKKQPVEIREKAFEILVNKFNDKYGKLSTSQRNLLREYINNISDTEQLKGYLLQEASRIKKLLTKYSAKVVDKPTRIKLEEVIRFLSSYDGMKRVKEENVIGLLRFQELVLELHKLHGDKK